MTAAYFSPSLNSFIPVEWKDDGTYSKETWPSDALLVTNEEMATFWKQTPPLGKQLGEVDGRPAWVNEPPVSQAKLIELAEQRRTALRVTADSEIAWRQDAVDANIATIHESAVLAEWKRYRVLLMRLDMSLTSSIEWPDLPQNENLLN